MTPLSTPSSTLPLPQCRLCGARLTRSVVDLGMSPPCESYLRADQLDEPQTFYPLNVRICESCLLVQLPAYVTPESVFSDYAYLSSYSTSWVEHARRFVEEIVRDLDLGPGNRIVEVASNDGYLLQHAVASGIPVLGIEPAANIAAMARSRGIPTECRFLGEDVGKELADRYGEADVVVGNNVFAHVPALLDFVRGLRALVADTGLVSLEFPHLLKLMEQRQYDTIYHEHFSYFTLATARQALATGDLQVVDVVELPTHGGSLRVLARPAMSAGAPSARVEQVLAAEKAAGLHSASGYTDFAAAVLDVKADLLAFLGDAARRGRSIAGYGAPGKGNTLLNHCGIRTDLLPFTVDQNPYKQGKYLPGTRIPVFPPEHLDTVRPEYILVLPWNLRDEIVRQLAHARSWDAKFVFPIPRLEIV